MIYPLISGDIAVVSLFTREWIEIYIINKSASEQSSPSLRGSGLKSSIGFVNFVASRTSPSLRGSGLK